MFYNNFAVTSHGMGNLLTSGTVATPEGKKKPGKIANSGLVLVTNAIRGP